MKIFKLLIVGVFLMTLVGCSAHTKVAQLDPNKECPPGEQCVSFVSGGMDPEGGGVVKSAFLIGGTTSFVDKEGKVHTVKNNAQTIVAGINPDRPDVWVGAVLGTASQVGSTLIQADAMKDVAKTQADAAKNAAPGFVMFNVANGGSGGSSYSSSGAVAQQTTAVQTNQSQGISSGPKILNPNN